MNSDNYLHRMTVLSAIGALAASVNKDVVHNSMLPAVVACSKVCTGTAVALWLWHASRGRHKDCLNLQLACLWRPTACLACSLMSCLWFRAGPRAECQV